VEVVDEGTEVEGPVGVVVPEPPPDLPELLQADKTMAAAMTMPTDPRTTSALTGGPSIGDVVLRKGAAEDVPRCRTTPSRRR
jgi:hypothetical protein